MERKSLQSIVESKLNFDVNQKNTPAEKLQKQLQNLCWEICVLHGYIQELDKKINIRIDTIEKYLTDISDDITDVDINVEHLRNKDKLELLGSIAYDVQKKMETNE